MWTVVLSESLKGWFNPNKSGLFLIFNVGGGIMAPLYIFLFLFRFSKKWVGCKNNLISTNFDQKKSSGAKKKNFCFAYPHRWYNQKSKFSKILGGKIKFSSKKYFFGGHKFFFKGPYEGTPD